MMNKQTVVNLFGVLHAFALSLAATGLIIVLGSMLIGALMGVMFVSPSLMLLGAFGYSALFSGVVFALVFSFTRFLVARMKFLPLAADTH